MTSIFFGMYQHIPIFYQSIKNTPAILFITIVPAVTYILNSVGWRSLALGLDLDYADLAWFPILRLYIVGEVIDERLTIGSHSLRNIQIIYPVIASIATLFFLVPGIGFVLLALLYVLNLFVTCRLLKLYAVPHPVGLTILGMIIPYIVWFYPFFLRNDVQSRVTDTSRTA